MPEVAEAEASRLALYGLVHPPLAEEPGLSEIDPRMSPGEIRRRLAEGQEDDFRIEGRKFAESLQWMKMEAPMIYEKLSKTEQKDGRPFFPFYSNWVPRGDRTAYQMWTMMTEEPTGDSIVKST